MPRPAKEEVPPSPLGACWLQRARCHGLEWQWEPGQQGAHTAQPVEYLLFYVGHLIFTATGLAMALDVLGGIEVLNNLYHMLQAQEFPEEVCRYFQEAFYNSSLVFTPRSCPSSRARSSPIR